MKTIVDILENDLTAIGKLTNTLRNTQPNIYGDLVPIENDLRDIFDQLKKIEEELAQCHQVTLADLSIKQCFDE